MSTAPEQADEDFSVSLIASHAKLIEPKDPIKTEADRLRIRREAERLIREEDAQLGFNPPSLLSRSALRQMAKDLPKYRIDGLMLADSDFVLIGEKKAGKSTVLLNMIQSLITGEPFLGKFNTRAVEGNILMLNYELSTQILNEWMEDLSIDSEKVLTLSPRGFSNPLSSDYGREWLAKMCTQHEVEVLMVDPFSVAFKGQGDENSNTAQREWLESLSDIRGMCNVREILVSIHAGKDQHKEARGAGAILDWAAAYAQVWRDHATQVRSLSAYGRDVDVSKFRLAYDSETHLLSEATETRFDGLNAEKSSRYLEIAQAMGNIVNRDGKMNLTALHQKLESEYGIKYRTNDRAEVIDLAKSKCLLSEYPKDGASRMVGPFRPEGKADLSV